MGGASLQAGGHLWMPKILEEEEIILTDLPKMYKYIFNIIIHTKIFKMGVIANRIFSTYLIKYLPTGIFCCGIAII